MLPEHDKSKPYPLSWEEQDRLFAVLPPHLQRMALFKVNVGLRDMEVCSLWREWEFPVPELDTNIFVIPGWIEQQSKTGETELVKDTKNGVDRLVVLSDTAKGVIEQVRGEHPEFVFVFRGQPLCYGMHNNGWQHARERVRLKQVRVHDLKHTFGRRLRAAGVSLEDRQDLLGHKVGKITTHYPTAEINNLIIAANKVCCRTAQGRTLTVLKTPRNPITIEGPRGRPRKFPASVLEFKKPSNDDLV